MNKPDAPLILAVDDDRTILDLIEHIITKNNLRVITTDSGIRALEVLEQTKPDLILLDIQMPGMNGYRLCTKIQKNKETALIPVIFVTALGDEQNKAQAFAVGAVDYLVKPIDKAALMKKINQHLKTNSQWHEVFKPIHPPASRIQAADFIKFKESLVQQLNLSIDKKYDLMRTSSRMIYRLCPDLGITTKQMAQLIADFLHLPYTSHINPEELELGILPSPFCRANQVVAIKREGDDLAFVLSDPFNLDLLDTIEHLRRPVPDPTRILITQPDNIETILKTDAGEKEILMIEDIELSKDRDKKATLPDKDVVVTTSISDMEKYPILYIANNILHTAVAERASDIHIEPKKENMVVRFRIDGDMREMFSVKKKTGLMLVSRLKVLADMDIAEKHKPQDGTLEALIDERKFKLRLATTSTPDGESLIVRLLEPYARPKRLDELGMTLTQSGTMQTITNRAHGMILIVGPTGSGKTTTIYSLLSQIDCRVRSLVSIEDPVEYRIPFANQQQVNDKAGVTFEAILKSIVRQDPDIIFLGEIRDQYSAKMAIDFASTGHLTVSTLHTSNATTAIFRLERLGINRGIMADAILCIIAQRLVKKLCTFCKRIAPPTEEERAMFKPFTDALPERIGHPVGCPQCNNTGYQGREGIYEILEFDPQLAGLVRNGSSITEIREAVRNRGDYLISGHALEKLRNLTFAPHDIYKEVLVEELRFIGSSRTEKAVTRKTEPIPKPRILLVDDDQDILTLISTILGNQGYEITTARDGIDALVALSKQPYDLIISDVNMPNLDGFKLLEIKGQKGIETPVIFLTSRVAAEDEIRGFELGAVDYIKKPIKKELLLLRIDKLLKISTREV